MGALQEENEEFLSSYSRGNGFLLKKPWLWILSLRFWFWKIKVGFCLGIDLKCWVKKWRVFDCGRRRKSWKWKSRTVMNRWCRSYGMKLLRCPAMVGLRIGDDEGEDLVDGKEWSEKRCWEDWRRTSLDFKKRNRLLKNKCEFRTRWIVKCENFRIPEIFQDREHAFWKMVIKAILHKVHIPMHFHTEILGRDREHAFWKMLTKAISQKGGRVVRISP